MFMCFSLIKFLKYLNYVKKENAGLDLVNKYLIFISFHPFNLNLSVYIHKTRYILFEMFYHFTEIQFHLPNQFRICFINCEAP